VSTVAPPAPVPRRRRRRTKLQRRQTRLAWLLLVPALAAVLLVAIYPLVKTVLQSFTNQEFLAGLEPTKWVGLDNYHTLIHDPTFRDTVVLTLKFTVITVSIEFLLGLVIALVVNSSFKGRGVMRAIMLVPWAIPTVVAATMWKWMLDDTFGVVNDLGVRMHILSHPHAWLAQPQTFQVLFGYRLGAQSMAVYNQSTIITDGHVGYGAAMSVAIFLIIALFVVIYVTFVRVSEE
jgi:ABC-type sugar transport system permease subunit